MKKICTLVTRVTLATILIALCTSAGVSAGKNRGNNKFEMRPPGDTVIRFIPVTIGPYCPKKLMGGDREFGGHGPEIWAWINLKIIDKKYIDAELYMHARETASDWSETEGTWTKRIYTAPPGTEIAEIITGKHSEVHYISRPGVSSFTPLGLAVAIGGQKGVDVPFKDDGLVSRWNIVGDTGGNDISDDDNPNDDTQVAVQLNPMKVKLIITAVPARRGALKSVIRH